MQELLNRLGAVHDLHSGTWLSADQMRAEVVRRAARLQHLVPGPVGRVVVAHGDTPAFLADLLAVWAVGGSAACIQPALTAPELATVVGFLQPHAILVDRGGPASSACADAVGASHPCPVIDLSDSLGAADAGGIDLRPREATRDALREALLLFTSGTTGAPKCVALSHAALQARIGLNQAQIGVAVLARSLCVLPTHFGHGLIGNCLTPWLAGGTLHLMTRGGLDSARRVGEVVRTHRIGFMSSVPAFWRLALRAADAPPPGVLQRVHIGSAPLPAGLWRDVIAWSGTAAVGNLYGTTETANWVGGMLATELPPEDGLVGRAWGGRLAVRADDGRRLDHGEGEVLVQTPSLMTGYLHRPDLTAEAVQGGWYHTGDRGHLDPGGVLRLTGRLRSMINRGGSKIYPEELDLLFERHPQVAEACAFGLPDAAAGESVHVALRLVDGAQLPLPDLMAWVRASLRPEAVPNRLHLVDTIPKTDRGKPDRAGLARRMAPPPHRAPTA